MAAVRIRANKYCSETFKEAEIPQLAASKTVTRIASEWAKKDLRTQFSPLAAICRTNWTVKMRLINAEKNTFHVLQLQPKKQRNS